MGELLATIILVFSFGWAWNHFVPGKRLSLRIIKRIISSLFKRLFESVKFVADHLLTKPDFRFNQVFLDNYPLSTLEFYEIIEEVFTNRQVVGAEISRITRSEWSFLSTRRIYVQIRYHQANCIIGGLSIGTGFQITWRYGVLPHKFLVLLFDIPIIGKVSEKIFAPPTFYRNDIHLAFEQLIRAVISESSNLLTNQGFRPLSEFEQRPLLREFYD
jgi:hypothetical protein